MTWLEILDLAGILVFAISGCLVALRNDMDVVGVISLGMATGLAGGVIRDVFIADLPPAAVRNGGYLIMPLVAAAVVVAAPRAVDRFRSSVLVFDAIGLGLFAAAGAGRAVEADLGATGAIVTGTVAAVGGGLVRDVLANEVPQIFASGSRLYAIPAALGAAIVVVGDRAGLPAGGTQAAAVAATILLRVLALRFRWSAPLPARPRPG